MIVPDSSVLIAGFIPSHRFHRAVLPSLVEVKDGGNLISHTLAETYSVLSAPGGIYRAEPSSVLAYLDQFLGEESPLPVSPAVYGEALSLLVEGNRPGGAIYDALIALAARGADATLVSLDRRAEQTYELCGIAARLLADV